MIYLCEFDGDFHPYTFHIGAFLEGKLVGITSYMNKDSKFIGAENQYQLRGMATLTVVRAKGYPQKMMDNALEQLKTRKMTTLWCNAKVVAVNFYKKNGFEVIGDSFSLPQIESIISFRNS